jgi:adenylosuccinate lyase
VLKDVHSNILKNVGMNTGVVLEANLLTTQIESHDTYAELCDIIRRANTILIDFNQDMWRYISDGWIMQKPKAGEVGSSTMPHKVNPIDFENSEGNLGMANAMLMFFATKLPISRLQRDLSDSTVQRNFGSAFGYSLLAYASLMKGLGKVAVSETNIRQALAEHPEVIAEAIQTVLRREKVAMPYEKLKELTRGRAVTLEEFGKFIEALDVTDAVKKELMQFTPENYIGLASKLAGM